ncbi:hypothetical protein AKJ57_05075 [candidate division MSBL1 archaeon SCGC-AAA259A05]|uniref:Helix-hairpin-helix DNA-binding motif class 1 domain-containing protein n=1 Tax=candidate division MSBL1 archaeon SCGC-AAA259A05 TaxID=1698259 RepID=A0A133U613_9EURY|nr:hypothetical protein AKJ57_05075 [candidate division MSBL1 archaeon SCGC-AAA259A05]
MAMKEFVKAIRENKPDEAKELIEKITATMGELEEISELEPRGAEELKLRGYDTIEKLAGASLDKLEKIPILRKGRAFDVLKASQKIVKRKLRTLSGVGADRAKELLDFGYTSIEDLAKASESDLTGVPKIGIKSTKKIVKSAQEKQKTIEDIPGVGQERAEKIRSRGFDSLESLAKAPVSGLEEIPGIGSKSAKKIRKSAEEMVEKTIEDLPNIGPDRAKEIRSHGYGSIADLAGASLEELVKVPCLEKGKAKEVLDSGKELQGSIQGYRRAMEGTVSALDSERDLTLIRKIADGEFTEEKLEEIQKEMKTKATQDFRPSDERGFSEAWVDILEVILKEET